MTLVLVAVGALAAGATAFWARTGSPERELRRFATILVVMQAIYLGFVAVSPSLPDLVIEAGFLVLCWVIARGAWRRTAWLLLGGYLLHGVWDLRHFALDTAWVPWGYAEACLGYDWLLLAYFLVRIKAWLRRSEA